MKIQRRYWPFYLIIALSLVLTLFFLLDWWPMLRGGYGWRWPYVRPESEQLLRIMPAVLSIAIYYYGIRKLRSATAAVYVTWCILGATIIPLMLLLWFGNPLHVLFMRTVSGLISGGFSVGVTISELRETIQNWPSMMPAIKKESIHIALSLPGWPAAYYSLTRLLEAVPSLSEPMGMVLRPILCNKIPLMNYSNAQIASSWLGIAAPFWAALTAIPLYLLGGLVADDSVSRKAIAWWPVVPSLTMFMGTLNTPTPLISITIVYLLWRGLTEPKDRLNLWLIAAGLLTGTAIIFTFAFVPLILFAGLLALVTWQRDSGASWLISFRKPVLAGIQFGLGLLLVFAVYTFIAGHTPFDVLELSLQMHLDLKRKYVPWLWLHSWDFIIFVGFPAFGLFVMGMTRWGRLRIRQLAFALSLTLAIVVLSGTGRGETGRLWLFFMPLVLLVAADILVQLPSRLRHGLVACQVIWFLALLTLLPTTGQGFKPPPSYEEVAFSPSTGEVNSTSVDFAGILKLDGYSAAYDASENDLIVDLYWRPVKQMAEPYFFSALLLAPDGTTLPAKDWQPFDYQFPTTCWQKGSGLLVDRVRLPLAEETQSGDYWMSLSIFHISADGENLHLPVKLPDGGLDHQVGLGPLRVQ